MMANLSWLWMFLQKIRTCYLRRQIPPPRVTPIPLERDQLIQRLLGKDHPVQPLLQECSSCMDMEILLQSLLVSSDGAATADGTPQQVDSGVFFVW